MPRCGGAGGVPIPSLEQGLGEKPRGGAPVLGVGDIDGAAVARPVGRLDSVEQIGAASTANRCLAKGRGLRTLLNRAKAVSPYRKRYCVEG